MRRKIKDKTATLGVIGLGYVGLPVACVFAEAGYPVIGVDIQEARVETINAGLSPIEGDEPGLAALLAQVVESGRFQATADYNQLQEADVISINVETPVDENNKPRYRALRAALRSLAEVLKPGALVIVESTVAPKTMDDVVMPLLLETTRRQLNHDLFLGHCPERVMPGKLLYNLRNLSRVCGGSSPEVADVMAALYKQVVIGDLDKTDCLTAEIVKTSENAYRDVQIAFANEMALLCESLGADVWQVRELVNKSPGRHMHLPGAGVGGHCIPKDGWLMIANAPASFEPRIIPTTRQVNDSMPRHMFHLTQKALTTMGVPIDQARVALFGFAYLEDSDDTRNTPSAPLIEMLRRAGAEVRIHDPFVTEYQGAWQDVAREADVAVFLVAHQQYRDLDLSQLASLLRNPLLVDGRHMFEQQRVAIAGLDYRCVGIAESA